MYMCTVYIYIYIYIYGSQEYTAIQERVDKNLFYIISIIDPKLGF